MPIDRETVAAAYRLFLRREPESEAVVDEHARAARTVGDFLATIALSTEYTEQRNAGRWQNVATEQVRGGPQAIEVEVDAAVLEKLLARIQREWKKLGEDDPYWSVLTDDRFRAGRMDPAAKQEFFASGKASADLLESFENRSARQLSRGTCFELGCGVGRVTYWLAQKFEKVIAADISPGNLGLCRKNLEEQGVTNVEYLLLDDMSAYDQVPEFDVLYSLIVLQHNPPPVQRVILGKLLRRVRAGGGVLFQTPSSLPGYAFEAAGYLESSAPVLEMHALPMPVVLETLHRGGLHALGVMMEDSVGTPGSYLYFAVK